MQRNPNIYTDHSSSFLSSFSSSSSSSESFSSCLFLLLLTLWHFDLLNRSIRIHSQLLGHQTINTVYERRRVCDLVARLDQGRLEQHLSAIQCCLVVLIGFDFGQQVNYDWMVRIDLERFAARHCVHLVLGLERLCLHYSLLLCGITELRSDHHHWRLGQTL